MIGQSIIKHKLLIYFKTPTFNVFNVCHDDDRINKCINVQYIRKYSTEKEKVKKKQYTCVTKKRKFGKQIPTFSRDCVK